MGTRVDDKLTPLSLTDAIAAFAEGYRKVFGDWPNAGQLACLVAQSALETGNWHAIHWFNFGNVKAGDSWDGLHCFFRCNEIIDGKVVWFDPEHPQTRFRAFETAELGAAEQVAFLALRERYSYAWAQASLGRPVGFVRALGAANYFTANVEAYARAVESIFNRIYAACASYLSGFGHAITADDVEHVHALVAVTLWDFSRAANETEATPGVA